MRCAGGGRTELLAAALRERSDHPGLEAETCVEAAAVLHAEANAARGRRDPAAEVVPSEEVARALEALRALNARLRCGAGLGSYDRGSLVLCARDLLRLLEGVPAQRREVA